MPKYNITVKLTGTDGNAFAVMAKVQKALKNAGATKKELDQYFAESTSGTYPELLKTAAAWVNIK